jgi:hypothetical protein
MQVSRRIFTVFLASPSDVEEERTIAEIVVGFVNKSVANRSGWQIDLRRWEETPPSFGRPQDSINPLVNECDLFIGLLWERWGQPTGVYSSGFEEEFELAKARRKSGGVPEIWLIFKDVDPSKMKDPGKELSKVIEFRESQIRLKEVKFQPVRHAQDWKEKLQSWLTAYILDFAAQHPDIKQQALETPILSSTNAGTAIQISSLSLDSSLPLQLKAASAALSTAAANDALDIFGSDKDLSEFEVARLFLLSGTLISHRYTNLVFGTHEINLLYKHRGHLDAATEEKNEILRSVIGTVGAVNPGWFWFQDVDDRAIFDQLFKFSIDDAVDDVRIGALDLLTVSRFEIPRESWPLLPLHHESWNVRTSAFKYLAVMGDENTIELLDSAVTTAEDSLSIADMRDARFRILSRLKPDAAFAEAISKDEFVSSETLTLLEECASNVGEHVLLQGVESSWEQMKRLCARELARRGHLATEVAHKLVQDSSLSIRAIALESLAEKGNLPGPRLVRDALKDPDADSRALYGGFANAMVGKKDEATPDADSIIVIFYSTQNIGATLAAVDWYTVDGPLAYKALALNHFEAIESTIREDIVDGFRRIKEESFRRYEEAGGREAAKRLESMLEKFDDFTKSQFTEAALLGLAKNGMSGDAEIAKPYLSQDIFSLRDAAVKVVCRFGDSGYASDLLKIAKETYGELQQEAAFGALKLSSNPLKTASELLCDDSTNLVKVAFSWMLSQDSRDLSDVIRDFLHDKNAEFRLRSLYWLCKRLQKSDMETTLMTYIENGTYYYDVVTWFDRLLYAPPRLREVFARKLEQDAT